MKELNKKDIKKVLEQLSSALNGRINDYQKAEGKEEDDNTNENRN